MTDFAAGLSDWDLTAVVSGYTASSFADDHHLLFGNLVFPEHFFDDSAISTSELELNDLYKPFYPSPDFDQFQCPFSSPTPPPPPQAEADKLLIVPDEEKLESFPVPDVVTPAADRCSKAAVGTKYRTRKNQQKRVVMEVTGEELSSDMWAWRKYGQKPIKGSPHPRSYYRCSSSKGCPARKMMERSQLDPGTFIMTYTGEHNHSKPTRRNSLAGTTRQRFPSVPTPAGETNCYEKKKSKKGMKKITELAEEMDYTCGESMVGDHYHHHNHMMGMGDDDSFMSALTQSNDLRFYQEHDHSSSFW